MTEEEKKKGFLSAITSLFNRFFGEAEELEEEEESDLETEDLEETQDAIELDEEEEEEIQTDSELSELQTKVSSLSSENESLKVKLTRTQDALNKANKKLKSLCAGLKEENAPAILKGKFNTFTDAMKYHIKNEGMNSEAAFDYCAENYPELYPHSKRK